MIQNICVKLADILDVEEIGYADQLRDLSEWDSLSILSAIAMVDSEYGVNLTAAEMRLVETPGGLKELIEVRLKTHKS